MWKHTCTYCVFLSESLHALNSEIFCNKDTGPHLHSGQDGGVDRYASLPPTTKRRITTNLKTKINQQCQKIKLYRSPTTKELKKKNSSRLVGRVETRSWGSKIAQQGSSWPTGKVRWHLVDKQSHICMRMSHKEQLVSEKNHATQDVPTGKK